jgi:hypothetical protein
MDTVYYIHKETKQKQTKPHNLFIYYFIKINLFY